MTLATGAFGYGFPINERISIPIKVRTDVVVGDLIAPAVSAGVTIRLPER